MESRKAKDGGLEMPLAVLQHRKRLFFEHRPSLLSIAMNGRIVAFQEVLSERNIFTARTEKFEETNFVEVFTEQDVRLAFIPILAPPPQGFHAQSQMVPLSDGRWLHLSLSFDGQGLYSEVTYFDPVLGLLAEVEDEEDLAHEANATAIVSLPVRETPRLRDRLESIAEGLGDLFARFGPVAATAWSWLLLLGISTTGYLIYRQMEQPRNAVQTLNRSVQVAASELQDQTEHQVLHLEERSSEGKLLQQGSIDLWKDGAEGVRFLHRLYNADHHLIAAEWQRRKGEKKSYLKAESEQDRALVEDGLWKIEISPRAFASAQNQSMQLRKTTEGYEVSVSGAFAGNPQVVSATLVLNRQWHFVRQVMHVRRRAEIYEVRFEQVSEERKPMYSVPDIFFGPETLGLGSSLNNKMAKPRSFSIEKDGAITGLPAPELAQLQIKVLYEMFQLGSDCSEPIEVVRTSEGRLRISGAVAQDSRKEELQSHFSALPNHQFLDVRISSPRDGVAALKRLRRSSRQQLEIFDVGQRTPLADGLLHRALASKRLSANTVNTAIVSFSRDALEHAQLSLQEATALYRLGHAFSTEELRGLPLTSQQLWAEMLVKHATSLQLQIDALSYQLDQLVRKGANAPVMQVQAPEIATPTDFSQMTESLLQQTRSIYHEVGQLFASNIPANRAENAEALVSNLRISMPRAQVEELVRFALKMKK